MYAKYFLRHRYQRFTEIMLPIILSKRKPLLITGIRCITRINPGIRQSVPHSGSLSPPLTEPNTYLGWISIKMIPTTSKIYKVKYSSHCFKFPQIGYTCLKLVMKTTMVHCLDLGLQPGRKRTGSTNGSIVLGISKRQTIPSAFMHLQLAAIMYQLLTRSFPVGRFGILPSTMIVMGGSMKSHSTGKHPALPSN